jgi:hypothetical protein
MASAFSSLQLSTPMIASKMAMTAMRNGLARVRFATAIASAPHRCRAAVAGLQVAQVLRSRATCEVLVRAELGL